MAQELPKSGTRVSFENNVRGRKWAEAYRDFNFMSMYEMLRAYRDLDASTRKLFTDQRDQTTLVPGQSGAGCNPSTPDRSVPNTTPGERPRMQYAVDVVDAQQMPDGNPPGDLRDTGQEEDAREFLAPVPEKLARFLFDQLNRAYPRGSVSQVKQTIGGKVNADWIKNTCAIRVSRVLNQNGISIPSPAAHNLDVVSGADNRWYSYRQKQLQGWFEDQFGPPSLSLTKPVNKRTLLNLQGFLAFDITSWADATGHIDIWDGQKFGTQDEAHGDYFAMANGIKFWRVPSWKKP
ncbi:MAG: hypothetical protein JO114_06955 [Planctomycetaceae bacterium]|nr:hypothetical protein [Planctomycetaceae bacterium]